MPAPGVIAAIAVRHERTAEIARSEGCDVLQRAGRQVAIVVLRAQLHVKLAQRGVEHLKVARVRIGEAVVMIPGAVADEKDLPHGKGAAAVLPQRAGAHVFDDVGDAAQRIGQTLRRLLRDHRRGLAGDEACVFMREGDAIVQAFPIGLREQMVAACGRFIEHALQQRAA